MPLEWVYLANWLSLGLVLRFGVAGVSACLTGLVAVIRGL